MLVFAADFLKTQGNEFDVWKRKVQPQVSRTSVVPRQLLFAFRKSVLVNDDNAAVLASFPFFE